MSADAQKITIRPFDKRIDGSVLHTLSADLQDFERGLDDRLPAGAEIADRYVLELLGLCASMDGKILMAERGDAVVGYVCVMTRVESEGVHNGGIVYGLVQDLVVAKKHQRQGIGRSLMEAAEQFAREKGVKWLRVGMLADNRMAKDLYSTLGYTSLYVEMEKGLD